MGRRVGRKNMSLLTENEYYTYISVEEGWVEKAPDFRKPFKER